MHSVAPIERGRDLERAKAQAPENPAIRRELQRAVALESQPARARLDAVRSD